MRAPRRVAHAATLLVGDVLAVVVSFGLAYVAASLIEDRFGWQFVGFHKGAGERATTALPIAAVVVLWMNARGHYRERIPHWSEVKDVLSAAALATVAESFIQYSVKEQVSRLWILLTWILFACACVAIRAWMKWSLSTIGLRDLDVLLIGDLDGRARAALGSERLLGYRVVDEVTGGSIADLVERFTTSEAVLAVIAVGRSGTSKATRAAAALSEAGIPFALCPPLGALGLASMRPLILFGQESMLLVERKGLDDPLSTMAKRAADVVVSAAALALVTPLVALAAAVVSTDGSWPFFAHARVGRGRRVVRVWKIRTMVPDAAERLRAHLAEDPDAAREWDRDRKLRRDPRTTRLGRLLRRTAVDELPQLWNVLKGEMSIVGPRPVTEEEMARYGRAERLYVGVRPGLTGLWQVSGRNSTTYERRVELDAWYVRNWSLWVDFVIVAKTFRTLLSGRGAY